MCFAQEAPARPLRVFVSILPQKYFVEKIGGDLVDVAVMVEPGASPHTYEPKPKQMVALAKTAIYFAIGVPFEATWLEKIAATNPNMLVVHTEADIKKIPMRGHHHQGPELEQDHHGIKDPHVWLSPPLVMIQARNILQALLRVDPAYGSVYEKNYNSFMKELVVLDAEIRAALEGKGQDVEFMVFHPAWGYFAQAYGIEQVAIEIEGKQPKPAELLYLIQYAKERGIKVIFAQPQFSWQVAQTIAKSIDGQIVFVDPLAAQWDTNLRQVASRFKSALK
jgi:zinc transport system substrate-binding protein